MGVEIKRAHQVSHLHRPEEFSVAAVDDDAIFLAVANPDIAVCRIDGEPMGRAEFSLAHLVAVPLIDELAVLVDTDDPRGADIVGGIIGIGIVWTLVGVTLPDVYVAVRSERHHHRLPQKPLSFRFIPIASASPLADRQNWLAVRTDFHHRGSGRRGDPDIVLGIDGHAVRLFLIAEDVLTNLKDDFVIRIELEQLRFSTLGALKDPEVSLRIEGDRRHAAKAGRQHVWVRECVAHRLFPLHPLQRPARCTAAMAAQR